MIDHRPRPHRVYCDCGFDEQFASEPAAKTILADHDDHCGYDTNYQEVADDDA